MVACASPKPEKLRESGEIEKAKLQRSLLPRTVSLHLTALKHVETIHLTMKASQPEDQGAHDFHRCGWSISQSLMPGSPALPDLAPDRKVKI